MKLYEIAEKISTAQDKEQAIRYMSYARENFPEFDFIMKLNNFEIEIEGVPRDFNPPIKNKEKSEFGKNIGWFWKAKTPFKFLLSVEGSLNYSPPKKIQVLTNMINSIPFDEVQIFLTAMRGELIDCEGEINTMADTHKYKAIFSLLSEKEDIVKVETVQTDNLVKGNQVSEELIKPDNSVANSELVYYNPSNENETWKGKGRKPKWLTKIIENDENFDVKTLPQKNI